MFLLFLDFLRTQFSWKIPAVFTYCSTRMLLSLFTCFFSTFLLCPLFVRFLCKANIRENIRSATYAPLLFARHEKKQFTPTMGGIIVLLPLILSLFLWMNLAHCFTLILLFTTLVFSGLGVYDDLTKLKKGGGRGISSWKKFSLQLFFSIIIVLYILLPSLAEVFQWKGEGGLLTTRIREWSSSGEMRELSSLEYFSRFYLPLFKESFSLPIWFIAGFMIFVLVGISNAVNLTDGLDGLATGSLIPVAASFSLLAFLSNHLFIARYLHIPYVEGSGEIAIYLSALAGGCLAFLWYNGFPAQIFMGDTGSLVFGGILGVCVLLLRREILLGIIGGVFLLETLSVAFQVVYFRYSGGKRIFLCAPLHHHFEYKGWHEIKIVIRFWILSLLFSLLRLATLKFQ